MAPFGPALYADRREAGRRLAGELRRELVDRRSLLVLGLPRGGVIVAAEVARALGAELDVLVVRKLGAPGLPELAVGAIAPGDVCALDTRAAHMAHLEGERLKLLLDAETEELHRREALYRAGRGAIDARDRTVIVVDDGVATGWTMIAALRALRRMHPHRVVVALPVGPEGCESAFDDADDVICLATPEPFVAVGVWYADFHSVSDAEVLAALA